MLNAQNLLTRFDPVTGAVSGAPAVARHLSDLRGCFADAAAFEAALAAGNPLVYTVASVEPAGVPGRDSGSEAERVTDPKVNSGKFQGERPGPKAGSGKKLRPEVLE